MKIGLQNELKFHEYLVDTCKFKFLVYLIMKDVYPILVSEDNQWKGIQNLKKVYWKRIWLITILTKNIIKKTCPKYKILVYKLKDQIYSTHLKPISIKINLITINKWRKHNQLFIKSRFFKPYLNIQLGKNIPISKQWPLGKRKIVVQNYPLICR